MSEYDHDAFDALRRLDGPAGLGDGAEDRIEAEMLARFDERAASATTADGASRSSSSSPRPRGTEPPIASDRSIALASAAAIAAVIAGVVLLNGRRPADRAGRSNR